MGRFLPPKMEKLDRKFFARPPETVARELLGCVLVRRLGGAILRGRIVETEAYSAANDPASHAYRGRTPRNNIMFGPPGLAYIYFIYGKNFCLNVVTEPEGKAGAVLIRALEPLEGIPLMQRFRGTSVLKQLTSGPGKLCQAFGIDRALNGIDLLGNQLYLIKGLPVDREEIVVTTRVGISTGQDLPWRFYLRGSPYVSRR